MKKEKISKYNFDTKQTELYDSLSAAAASVDTNQELWKVELTIANVNRKKAFKHGWRKVIEK